MPLDANTLVEVIPYGLVIVAAYFIKRTHAKIESDIEKKADKVSLTKEIDRLNMELTKVEEARERDMQRMERISTERIDTIKESINSRLDSMERGINDKLKMMMEILRP